MGYYETLESLKQQLLNALKLLEPKYPMEPQPTENCRKIYNTAKSLLGVDASPADIAPDYLSCAESVWNIIHKATGKKIGGPFPIVSTKVLYETLKNDPGFESVIESEAPIGSIIISPTGYAMNPRSTGHCGIVARFGILSNSSETSHLEENYTLESWRRYFGDRGFPVIFFKML